MILYNNREILVGAKPFFFQEWFSQGIRTISDLLDEGNILSFVDYKSKRPAFSISIRLSVLFCIIF